MTRSKTGEHLYRHRYIYLFIATMLQVFLTSFIPTDTILPIDAIVYSFFILMILNMVRHSRKLILIMLLLGTLGMVLVWIRQALPVGTAYLVFQRAVFGIFIALIIYHIMVQIIKSHEVDATVIFGAITIYILFGMLAGEANLIIQAIDPRAFTGNVDLNDSFGIRYYSFVTITTLGYGDISPVSQVARTASVFFALIAQIYLAVIIAFIVGKLVAHSGRKNND